MYSSIKHTYSTYCSPHIMRKVKSQAAGPMIRRLEAEYSQLEMGNPQDDIDQYTPYIAASEGNLGLLKRALDILQAPISLKDDNGLTLVHSAASYNQLEILEWLLCEEEHAHVVDVNARDSDGDTPLHHCDSVDAARFLIEVGRANYSIKNDSGLTVLEVKEQELQEYIEEEGEQDDDDDSQMGNLRELVFYLKSLQ